jgi:hypothetical protein
VRALLAILLTATAAAQFPALDRILPRGGQRGTTVEVSLRGKQLASARELLIMPGGVTVEALEAKGEGKLRATLVLAPDAELGPRAIWVRTACALTNLGTFHVGALPEVAEVEPNGTPGEAQVIALGSTVSGVAANEDVDLYTFEGSAGARVSVELEGQRLGDRLFDAAVAVLDARGFTLDSCDDSALGRQDPALTVVLPEDGRYTVQVRESAYRGADDCYYRLHVGTFPRPQAVLPLGGRAGEELELRLLWSDGHVETTRSTLPAPRSSGGWVPSSVSAASIVTDAGVSPTPAWFRVSDLDNVFEVEPNVAWAEATSFTAPAALNGVLQQQRDLDRFRFIAKKGEVWMLVVHARSLRTPVDPVLSVFYADGRHIKSNDDEGGPDSRLEFKAPEDGEFVLQVRDHLMRGGPAFAYRVEVQRPRPSLAVGIGGQRPQVAVPQGGRTVITLNVDRERYGGPVDLTLADLPPGVTAAVAQVPGGVNTVSVVFEAAPEAALASALVRVDAAAPERELTGSLLHPVELVTGNNQRVFWAHTLDRLPLAVTDPAPIALEVAPPGVPLPRGGRVHLDVNLSRAEGFKGTVALRILGLPPGVNTTRELGLDGDAIQGRFDLDASGDARKGKWSVVVSAVVKGPNGSLTVASTPVPLEITGPLLTFKAEPVSVDRGQGAEMFVEVERGERFAGQATVDLVNLPHQVTSQTRTVDVGTESLVFPLATTGESPIGKHNGLQFTARIALPEGEVLQGLAAAELRVQKPAPAPAKVVEASAPKPEPKKKEKKEKKEKRPPTRLEKLRAEHAERLKEGEGER